jgi:hypothetical protein
MLRILSIIGISAALAFLAVFLVSDPSTKTLDADLITIRKDVVDAQSESAKYSGGLLKSFIEVRVEILRSTEAMLVAKRTSLLRRIDLAYVVDGKHVPPAKLSDIEIDIVDAKKRIGAAEQKAAQYSGGLIQMLELTSVTTERMTLAQLYFAYYSAKYDLPSPNAFVPRSKAAPPNPGTVVPDKDAL